MSDSMNRKAINALKSTAVGKAASIGQGEAKSTSSDSRSADLADFATRLKAFGFQTSMPFKSFDDLKVGADDEGKH
jgi:hypothetical protein